MSTESAEAKERKKPGPKPDERPSITFRLQEDVYDKLAELQPKTGMKPDESAALLLHMLILDPPRIVDRLRALLGDTESEGTSVLAARRRQTS